MTNYVVENLALRCGVQESDVVKQLAGWETHDYIVNGEVIGTGMSKGTEIHVALSKAHYKKGLRRDAIRTFLKPLFDRIGFLTTRVLIEHAEQARFVERIGFEKTWSDGRFNYYLLANLPYERNK